MQGILSLFEKRKRLSTLILRVPLFQHIYSNLFMIFSFYRLGKRFLRRELFLRQEVTGFQLCSQKNKNCDNMYQRNATDSSCTGRYLCVAGNNA